MTTAAKRVLSGMRPTGRLHIGHYFGALENWVKLQADPSFECFYFVADWHALTSDYADTSAIAENSLQITIDFLAAGLDPDRCTIFLQSKVPDHAELHLLLSMVTPLGWLERIPTYKEALENIKNKDLHTYGFLGYPTLQTADIVLYSDPGKPLFVPVGEDQVSHVEFSRELVRRFNLFYGLQIDPQLLTVPQIPIARQVWFKVLDLPEEPLLQNPEARPELKPIFIMTMRQRVHEIGIANFFDKLPDKARKFFSFRTVLEEPQALLTPTPRIPGLDGRKMSKSYGNAISLSESDSDIRLKTKVMVTDPARKRRSDPGNPEMCPAYDWHKLFSPRETLVWAAEGCRTAAIGCIECKSKMADHLIEWIEPVRARRVKYEQAPGQVFEILESGSARAAGNSGKTLQRVRDAIFGWAQKRAALTGP